MRNRLARVADALETDDSAREPPLANPPATEGDGDEREIIVLIDGAHIRAAPGQQSRHLDVTVGKVEAGATPARRFALAPGGARHPAATVRAALIDVGWRPGAPVTVISDGEPGLPALVRAAVGAPVAHVLDWWHISARVRHVEQALNGLYALKPSNPAALDYVAFDVERARHLLWNGCAEEVRQDLWDLQHVAAGIPEFNDDRFSEPVRRFLDRCADLRGYLDNNTDAVACYGDRRRSGLPVSTARAEACVEEIANARMAKRRRMRWSPRGAHRVATVRAAVLDRRLPSRPARRAAA